ncbi:hypothetical protein AB0D46_30990 [Streptomyces sp. NPDC048383]|uniref:hypothetical protein n=1 Tax=Streptomyces sp. NPDC048383 TaxID=3155386 RepID=UPI0034238E32
MPTMLVDEPLSLACVFNDGRRAEYSLDGLPNPRLARDLATGLVDLIHPHGTADSAGTVTFYVQALRNMVRTLAEQGFTGGAAQLRRGQLAEFWMGSPRRLEALTRALWEGFAQVGGVLDAGVMELATGRHFNPQPNRHVLPPYSEAEWQRLTEVCRTLVDDSYTAHRQALAAAAEGRHPREGGWKPGNLRWLLARVGPVSISDFGQRLDVSAAVVHNRGGFHDATRALFPHLDVLIAYRLLFGICSGIVPDGIVRGHRLGRGLHGPALLRQTPHRGGEPGAPASGSATAGAVAGPLRAAAKLRARGGTRPPVVGGEPGRRRSASAADRPRRGPARGPSPRSNRG